jgi:hypothetical protein
LATSSRESAAPATRYAIRNGVQTGEQMDSRRSIYSCRGAVCRRCCVGRGAAGKTGGRSRRACSRSFGGGVTFETSAESDTAIAARRRTGADLTLGPPGVCRRNLAELHSLKLWLCSKPVLVDDFPEAKLGLSFNNPMNQLMLTFPSSNFLLQAQRPPVQRLSLSDENRPARGTFCLTEINRWIGRWENEGGALAVGGSADYVKS